MDPHQTSDSARFLRLEWIFLKGTTYIYHTSGSEGNACIKYFGQVTRQSRSVSSLHWHKDVQVEAIFTPSLEIRDTDLWWTKMESLGYSQNVREGSWSMAEKHFMLKCSGYQINPWKASPSQGTIRLQWPSAIIWTYMSLSVLVDLESNQSPSLFPAMIFRTVAAWCPVQIQSDLFLVGLETYKIIGAAHGFLPSIQCTNAPVASANKSFRS